MNADHFSPDTWEFIRLLDRYRVQYVIVGGEAVIHYGHARLTGNVDFFYGRNEANVERLFATLLDFWDGDIPGVGQASDLSPSDQVIQFGRPPNRIDLLTTISGVTFEDAWRTRETLVADDGTPVHLISLDLLIRNKEASARPKDMDDAAFLREAASRNQC
ncbi:MAG: nucleotidyl transferase AbiEii/AbiGii toxin family protein [Rubricoccaceae bacterium]